MIQVHQLPTLNAILNTISFILLVSGFIAIKKGNKELHKKLMVSALAVSAAFLSSYLVYHYHIGSNPFPELGFVKKVYLFILIPHIILAAVQVPLIILTFYHAFKGNFQKHMKWAKITFPIWLYVCISGVLVYLMLYVWYAK